MTKEGNKSPLDDLMSRAPRAEVDAWLNSLPPVPPEREPYLKELINDVLVKRPRHNLSKETRNPTSSNDETPQA